MNRIQGSALAAIFGAVGCSSGDDAPAPITTSPPPPPPNIAPTANAGAAQASVERATVFLDGSASADSDGSVASFEWTQTGGPVVTITDANTALASIVTPEVNQDTVLEFELRAVDNDGAAGIDSVAITVSPDPVDDAEIVFFSFEGLPRAFTLYTPETFQPGAPAYFVLHGGSQSMRRVLEPDTATRQWVDVADRDGALLIVPNGFNNTVQSGLGDNVSWNDIRVDGAGQTSSANDAGFLLEVLDRSATLRDYDTDSVFIAGSSNGGIMTMTMLIQSPERFSAGAAFIAALPEEDVPDPATATPFFMLNGTEDPLILFEGGTVGEAGSPTRSVPDTVDYWTRVTGSDLSTEAFSSLPNSSVADNCEITETLFADAPGGQPTFVFYEAIGGGHNIPDPDTPPFPEEAFDVIGNQCRDVQGIELAVDFFKSLGG
ncbi:MAG: prolyl oligopeptidase family serine peptidase [Pseudomonadota bacterium]